MPYQVTAPWTQSEASPTGAVPAVCCSTLSLRGGPADPAAGSRAATPQDVAASAASWPPAEAPQTMIRAGSTRYFPAFARSQRIEALTSWMAAGCGASPANR